MTPLNRLSAVILVGCACGFPAIDYSGKTCPDGRCPAGYTCAEGLCQSDTGGGSGGGSAGGAAGGAAGGTAGGGAAGGAGGGLGGDGGTLVVAVATDQDDATWTGVADPPTVEQLYFPGTGATPDHLQVGSNNNNARGGLRFVVRVPRNATIDSATLTLTRLQGNAAATDTILVETWSSARVPAFDAGHSHTPAQHAGGLAAPKVTGWVVGAGGPTTSPSLVPLVQYVVNRADWDAGGAGSALGFVLSPDVMTNKWVGFEDARADSGVPDGGPAQLFLRWH